MTQIHFLGIGNMGLPMATNLHKAGCRISVFDISEQQKKLAKKQKINVIEADQVGKHADLVISILPAGEHMRSAIIEQDIAGRMNPGGTIIDSSTVDLQSTLDLADYCTSRAIESLDAPVSGGIVGAGAGTLTFMVGGRKEVFNQYKPLLEIMGTHIFHAGAHGAGQTAKMCNNMMLAISMIGVSEALTLGHNLGIDASVLSEIMRNASGNNWPLQVYNPWPGIMPEAPASHSYRNGFKSKLMLKDLMLAEGEALASNTPVHLGSLARNLYTAHCLDEQQAESDFSSIIRHYAGR